VNGTVSISLWFEGVLIFDYYLNWITVNWT